MKTAKHKSKQLFLDSNLRAQRMNSFGGSLLKRGHARTARPLSSKDFIHIVLKSDIAQKTDVTDLRMSKKQAQIAAIIFKNIQNFGVRIRKLAIASNHIHLLISYKSRRKYFDWIRRITGLIARLMLKKERGLASKNRTDQNSSLKKLDFWSQRPFTRIVKWGNDYKIVLNYIQRNILEALGFIVYVPRALKYRSTS